MLAIQGTDYTVFLLGLKRLALKFIPAYLIALTWGLALGAYLGVFGSTSAGVLSGNQLVGLLVAFVAATTSLCDGVAWMVYGLVK